MNKNFSSCNGMWFLFNVIYFLFKVIFSDKECCIPFEHHLHFFLVTRSADLVPLELQRSD